MRGPNMLEKKLDYETAPSVRNSGQVQDEKLDNGAAPSAWNSETGPCSMHG